MFWAGAVALAKLLTRRSTTTLKACESYTSEITGTDATQEVNSVQRESSETALGKQKKVRPPKLCMQDELDRNNVQSIRDGATSNASSRRSSASRAEEKAAAAKTAMFQEETGAQRALARFADTRAECNEQHKAMPAEFEALQSSVKESLRATNKQRTAQFAKVDAMRYRLEEMKYLFLQRELRTEV